MSLLKRVLAEKRRLVLPIAVVFAANVIVFAAAVLPLARKVDNGGGARRARRRDAPRRPRRATGRPRRVVSGKARADEELRKFYHDVLPADWTAARRITYLRLVQLAAAGRADAGAQRGPSRRRTATARSTGCR